MRKIILGTLMLAALATVAAQQPATGEHGQMPMNGMMMQSCPMGSMMGSVDVKYEATQNGASLTFTPKDPQKLAELQTKLREMADRMAKGDGSMMKGMMNHDDHHPEK